VNVSHPQAGMQQYSLWLLRDDLVRLLHDVGYGRVRVLRDWYDRHQSHDKQSVTIFAEKDGA